MVSNNLRIVERREFMREEELLRMIDDTSKLVAENKAQHLGEVAVAYKQSAALTNDVEFWKWMGANYPKDLSSSSLIQRAATDKSRWLNTQLQGKGYEWDYMVTQRSNPTKLLSKFEAGDCPTQAGIDITEINVLDGSVMETYQNKAYLSSNNPNLHNTPKDAIVVTNKEKVAYAKKQGYQTEQYMDADKIKKIRDVRYKQAASGKASTTYNLRNVATASAKAGVVGVVIGMTTETMVSYRAWKDGKLSDREYLDEVLKAGGDAGITATATTAAMIPVQSAITVAGASTLIGIPVAILFGSAINSIVAPCFGRGKYRTILGEAKYYQELENIYDDFIRVAKNSAEQYMVYVQQMELQANRHAQMREMSKQMNVKLKDLYDSI